VKNIDQNLKSAWELELAAIEEEARQQEVEIKKPRKVQTLPTK